MAWENPEKLRAGDVFDAIWKLAALGRAEVIAYVGVLSVAGVLSGYLQLGSAVSNALNIAQVGLQYWLTLRVLEKAGLMPRGPQAKFWAYFGLSLLSGLAIILGLVLLVIPGVILLIRWLPSVGILLVEGEGVSHALGESWRRTKPHFLALLGATLPAMIAFVAAIVVLVLPEYDTGVPLLVVEIVGNILAFGASAFFTLLGIAAFSLIGQRVEELGEVFA